MNESQSRDPDAVDPKTSGLRCRVRIGSAEGILAVVPHLLGFQPADSLVMLGIGGPHDRIRLAFRYDLPDPPEDELAGISRSTRSAFFAASTSPWRSRWATAWRGGHAGHGRRRSRVTRGRHQHPGRAPGRRAAGTGRTSARTRMLPAGRHAVRHRRSSGFGVPRGRRPDRPRRPGGAGWHPRAASPRPPRRCGQPSAGRADARGN